MPYRQYQFMITIDYYFVSILSSNIAVCMKPTVTEYQ